MTLDKAYALPVVILCYSAIGFVTLFVLGAI